jgi:hypothetical protein
VRGKKSALIAHILGHSNIEPCTNASEEARRAATDLRAMTATIKPPVTAASSNSKRDRAASSVATESLAKKMKQTDLSIHSYKGIDMPFSPTEAAAIQAQTLRATISGNAPFRFFEDVEVLKLIQMLRTAAPDIMPSAKVVGGRLLNEAPKSVETKISKILKKKDVGLSYVL